MAFAELEAAARTDPVLARRWPRPRPPSTTPRSAALRSLLQAGAGPRFQTSRDLARFLLEGLARGDHDL